MALTTRLPRLACLAFGLPILFGPTAFGGDWPQYNGAHHDRRSSEVATLASWGDKGPDQRWSIKTDLGFSSFTVAEGLAYTLVNSGGRGGSEVLLAVDAETGKEQWRTQLGKSEYDGGGDAGADGNKGGDGPRSTPAYANGRILVLGARLDLYAIDATKGTVLWMRDLVKDHGGRLIKWQNAASPLLVGDLVLVAGGGEGEALLAFNADDGSKAWGTGDDLMTHATPIVATLHGVTQAIFLTQSGPVAVVPETGEVLWRAEFPYRISSAASPVVFEDMVYCSAGYGVGAATFRVRHEDGKWSTELVWRKANKLMNHWSTPTCIDGHLYGMFSFKKYGTGPLQCVDMRTGKVKWSQDGYGPGNCIAVGDRIIALSDTGSVVLVAAQADRYQEIVRAQVLDGKCWSSPSFSNGRLYVRSTKEGCCLNLVSDDA